MSDDLRDANVEQAQTVELIRAKDRLTDAIVDYAVASQTATASNRGRADEKWSCVIETRDALISAVQAQARDELLAKLQDPAAVRVHMMRGVIGKICDIDQLDEAHARAEAAEAQIERLKDAIFPKWRDPKFADFDLVTWAECQREDSEDVDASLTFDDYGVTSHPDQVAGQLRERLRQAEARLALMETPQEIEKKDL